MSTLTVALLVGIFVLLCIAIVFRHKWWTTYAMIGALTLSFATIAVGIVTRERKSISCDPSLEVDGAVFNNDLRCRKTGDGSWQCYMPYAECAAFGAEVRKIEDKHRRLIKKLVDDVDYTSLPQAEQVPYLKLKSGTILTQNGEFLVDGCISEANKPCFDLTIDTTTKAYKELPWPVVRYAVGTILGGG